MRAGSWTRASAPCASTGTGCAWAAATRRSAHRLQWADPAASVMGLPPLPRLLAGQARGTVRPGRPATWRVPLRGVTPWRLPVSPNGQWGSVPGTPLRPRASAAVDRGAWVSTPADQPQTGRRLGGWQRVHRRAPCSFVEVETKVNLRRGILGRAHRAGQQAGSDHRHPHICSLENGLLEEIQREGKRGRCAASSCRVSLLGGIPPCQGCPAAGRGSPWLSGLETTFPSQPTKLSSAAWGSCVSGVRGRRQPRRCVSASCCDFQQAVRLASGWLPLRQGRRRNRRP